MGPQIIRQRRGLARHSREYLDIRRIGIQCDPLLFHDRRFRRERPGPFILGRQVFGRDFADFHIRLVERVD
ncbi:MAG: hypothetical protein L0Z46_10110, partial [Nitrospiraceae bacterium]|nr:hypothetical protein [Nitrospiraceae bacterium]